MAGAGAGAGAVCGGIWAIWGCWEDEAIVVDFSRINDIRRADS